MTVRTRFAPSPTGYLHIGGVRTAIFNWAFARRHGGQFILRIDDTDVERHQEETLQPILQGLRWLGLHWDEGPEIGGPFAPYFQSQRLERYRRVAEELLSRGQAYPCFCRPEDLEQERQRARQAGAPFRYSGKCRNLCEEERADRIRVGMPYVVRLKVEPGRKLHLVDAVLGAVEQSTTEIGDFVLLRANGTPLYNFATVVDDLEMKITHVIRAQEHLSNTFPQLLLYEALGAPLPVFAHVPYVAAPGSRTKLSKRDLDRYRTPEEVRRFVKLGFRPEEVPNPVMLDYYIQLGYLPEAVLNGLARLGWSLDERTEKISRQILVQTFSLERIHKSPASFDPDKLYWLQGEYMRELPLEEKVEGVIPFLRRAGLLHGEPDEATRKKIRRVVEVIGDRMKVFSDIVVYGAFFFTETPQYDPEAVEKHLRDEETQKLLRVLAQRLAAVEPFEAAQIEKAVREVAAQWGVRPSKLIHPLRVAASGQTVGPGLFELIEILGREETCRRIDLALQLAAASSPASS
jgi:glutamyl/glutaminyl-tRNA synthetase